jgi:hypothetical protein
VLLIDFDNLKAKNWSRKKIEANDDDDSDVNNNNNNNNGPYNRNTAHVECKNKGDTSNNRRDLDHFKVI